jgi:hypothetical protein
VERPADLRGWAPGPGRCLVQPYFTDELRSVAGVIWRGGLAAVVHQRFLRTWPPDCGMACAAETVPPDLELEDRLVALLDGYEGIFQIDMAGGHLLDVNPRVYASLPLAVAAGANLAGLWCDLLRGEAPSLVRARPGVFFRWLDGDVRNVGSRLRKREIGPVDAARALRPRSRAVHDIEPFRDPGPVLARLRHAVASLRGSDEPPERQVGGDVALEP